MGSSTGGDDLLFGGSGGDTIRGDAPDLYQNSVGGDDTVVGGAGNDTLWGDGALHDSATTGADIFVFAPGSDIDTIEDFESSKDKIDVSGYTNIDFSDITANTTVSSGNTIVDLGAANGGTAGQDIVTILNDASLTSGDFIFAV